MTTEFLIGFISDEDVEAMLDALRLKADWDEAFGAWLRAQAAYRESCRRLDKAWAKYKQRAANEAVNEIQFPD